MYTASLYISTAARDYDFTADYNKWKSTYVTSSGANGNLRVQRDLSSAYDTVSEGIGYGMLLAVYFGDQATFDKLYNYCQAHFISSSIPLMHWKVDSSGNNVSEFADYKIDPTGIVVTLSYGIPGYLYSATANVPHGIVYGNLKDGSIWILPEPSTTYVTAAQNYLDNSSDYYPMDKFTRGLSSAADADQDIAAALCFACKVWPNNSLFYGNQAKAMITAIKQNDFGNPAGGKNNTYGKYGFIMNGSGWGGNTGWNPSYFAPAYYINVFAMMCPDQYDFWTNAYNTMYAEMKKISDYVYSTGKSAVFYPDWCNTSSGKPVQATTMSDRYYYNNGTAGTGPSMIYPQSAMWTTGTKKGDYTKSCMSFNQYYDGIRVPWRIALDVAWDMTGASQTGNTWAQGCLLSSYKAYKPILSTIVDGYQITGDPWNWDYRDGFNNSVGGKAHSTTFIAMGACALIGVPGVDMSSHWNEVVNANDYGNADYNYYGNTLRLLSMLFLSGKFENLYNSPPPSGTIVRIRNYWKGTYMNIEHTIPHIVECSSISSDWTSAKWIIQRTSDGYYTFAMCWSPPAPNNYKIYLHEEDNNAVTAEWDKPTTGNNIGVVPNTGWWSSQWILEQTDAAGYYRFKNRWTGTYLYIEHQYPTGKTGNNGDNSVEVENGNACSSQPLYGNSCWFSSRWGFEIVQ